MGPCSYYIGLGALLVCFFLFVILLLCLVGMCFFPVCYLIGMFGVMTGQ